MVVYQSAPTRATRSGAALSAQPVSLLHSFYAEQVRG